MAHAKKMEPIHPAEILKQEFMMPLGLSANALARALDVPPGRITQIVNGVRAVTADTALRLARYFGVSPSFWMNLQLRYELELASDQHGAEIENRVRPHKAA